MNVRRLLDVAFAAGAWIAGGLAVVSLAVILYQYVTETQAQVTGLRSVPLGYEQVATLTTSTALTVPADARMAVFTPETQAVRYRDDGTAPTAAVGMPLAVGVTYMYSGNLAAIRFIEQVVGAKLNVSYYR